MLQRAAEEAHARRRQAAGHQRTRSAHARPDLHARRRSKRFRAKYRIVETDPDTIAALPAKRACRGPLHRRPAAAVARDARAHDGAALHLQRRDQPPQQHALRPAVRARHPCGDDRRGVCRAGRRARPRHGAQPGARHRRRRPRLPQRLGAVGRRRQPDGAADLRLRDRHRRLRRSRPRAEPAAVGLPGEDPRVRSVAAALDPRRPRRRAGRASTRCWQTATTSSSSPR